MDNEYEKIESIYAEMNDVEREIGIVVSFSGGCVVITGFKEIIVNEKIIFENNKVGLVFDITEDKVFAFVISNDTIGVGSRVQRTREQYKIPVGLNMVGHIFDVKGNCIDGSPVQFEEKKVLVERAVPGMILRAPICKPLEVGILLIDSLIPIGKGQRQLFIGNKNTGKTYSAISSFIRQKNEENVVCIYVSIGQQKSQTLRAIRYLEEHDAFKHTIVVSADAFEPALAQYLAPYVGAAIAEFYAHEHKKDVVIIYDDLSNHAIAYRELCLLMRRPPSREAYPGDVFYLHARLLERAGNFLNSGSITALPIAQLQEDDFSSYIPTNLVSITDGQIIFDTKLFNKGIKPAINSELSVSRVGSAAQFKTISQLSKSLRLELAQYNELAVFSQFSSDLDIHTAEQLEKGKFLVKILNQSLRINYSVFQKYIILYIFKFFYKEAKKIEEIFSFFSFSFDFFESNHQELVHILDQGNALSNSEEIIFKNYIEEIFLLYQSL